MKTKNIYADWSDSKLRLENGSLQSAFWNAARQGDSHKIKPEAREQYSEIQKELNRRAVK